MSSDSEIMEEQGNYKQDIKNVCDSVIDSVCKQVRKANYGDFKLFLGKSQKKSDIQRVIKEKQFIRSTEDKRFIYNEPQMPLPNRSPDKKQFRAEQHNLKQKAKQFIQRMKSDKKNHQGKMYLLRKEEREKKKYEQHRKQIQETLQRELQRKLRKMKAEKNIEYFREKNKIFLRNNTYSRSPKKRKLSELTSEVDGEEDVSPQNSRNLESIQEDEQEFMPNGFRKIPKRNVTEKMPRISPSKQDNYDDEENQNESNSVSLKVQEVKVDVDAVPLKSRPIHTKKKFTKKGNTERKYYVISRNRGEDYGDYIDKYTNQDDLKKLIRPSKAHSQRDGKGRFNQSLDFTSNQSHRFFKSSISRKCDQQQFSEIKRKVQTAIEDEMQDEIIKESPRNFPLLNKIKANKKRLRTFSNAN